MDEKRKNPRMQTADYAKSGTRLVKGYFRVYDRITDKAMGYMIDISSEGMKIMSRMYIRENDTYQIRVELPEEVRGSDHLIIDVRSVWCERDPETERYQAGFAFVSTFPHHEEVIRLLFARADDGETEMIEPVEEPVSEGF